MMNGSIYLISIQLIAVTFTVHFCGALSGRIDVESDTECLKYSYLNMTQRDQNLKGH